MFSNVWANFKNVIPLVGFSPVLVGVGIGSLINEVFLSNKGKSSKEEVKDLGKEKELLAQEILALAVQKSRILSAVEELERTLEEKRQKDLSETNEEFGNERARRFNELEVEVSHHKEKALEELERTLEEKRQNDLSEIIEELGNERERRFNDLEVEVSHHKEKALEEVLQWSQEEVKRLHKRYDKEYRLQLMSVHDELNDKVHEEFNHIHKFFESFSKQKKALAEKDILSFLEIKEKGIKEFLKQRPFSL